MVTGSYVSKEMQSLNEEAMEAGIIILNELGLDPGIHIMYTMHNLIYMYIILHTKYI